ncbi:hypothetical protein AOLI_G00040460 [Acnodon oligacanthus]
MLQATNSSLQLEADLMEYCYPESNVSCVKSFYGVSARCVLYVLLVLAMSVTVLGNSVVIISIAHFKQLHTPTNMLVMSLALADLLLGVIVMPFSMIRSVDGCWYFGEAFCLLHSSFDMLLTSASTFHLMCIATDRYQAVCHPLQYPTRITIPTAWLMVALSWITATGYSYGLMYSKANVVNLDEYIESISCLGNCNIVFNALWGPLDALLCFLLPCTVMFCLYARIFLVSKRHARKIEGTKQSTNETSLNKASQSMKQLPQQARADAIDRHKQQLEELLRQWPSLCTSKLGRPTVVLHHVTTINELPIQVSVMRPLVPSLTNTPAQALGQLSRAQQMPSVEIERAVDEKWRGYRALYLQ